MASIEIMLQVMWWSMFFTGCVGLYLALTWPNVKGKSWLVVSLFVVLMVELLTHLLQMFLSYSNNAMMGPDRYQQIITYSFLLRFLSTIGEVLFVVALFQLRSQLREFLAALSGRID